MTARSPLSAPGGSVLNQRDDERPRRGGRAAVFFDRDGTLCEERGYINHPSRLVLAPGAAEALRRVRRAGRLAIVVTNQAGIARGYFPEHVLHETHERMVELLAAQGAGVDAIYAATSHPDVGPPELRRDDPDRKPGPGMLLRAAREHDIDLARSAIVGDSFKDIGAGRRAGVGAAVLLRTGYGRGELLWKSAGAEVWPDWIADDLLGAVDWILGRADLGGGAAPDQAP